MRPKSFEFPFVGAGKASIFEWAEIHVIFVRPPTAPERAAIEKAVPVPMRETVRFTGRHLVVAGGERGWFTSARLKALDAATDRWLLAAHRKTPIELAFRREDLESSGTRFSPWHAWSVKQVPAIVAEFGRVKPPFDYALNGAVAMAKKAKVRFDEPPDPGPVIDRALAAGRGLELTQDNAAAIAARLDLSKAQHRKALCAIAPAILKKLNGKVSLPLLAPLAHAVLVERAPIQRKVVDALIAKCDRLIEAPRQELHEAVHREIVALGRRGKIEEALEILLPLAPLNHLAPVLYYNALGLMVTPKLRRPAAVARKVLASCLKQAHRFEGIHHNAACVYLALGERDAALEQVELALAGWYEASELLRDAQLRPLHAEPRWVAAIGAAQKAAKARRRR